MKPDMTIVKKTWSNDKIRIYIKTNLKKLSSETLGELYAIISWQNEQNNKFLDNLVNSKIVRLAYMAECMRNRRLQDLPLGDFINSKSLLKEFGMRILDNMVTIKDYFSKQNNCSKIAKIRWSKGVAK